MRPPEDDVLLRDMLAFSQRAVAAIAERDRSDLDSDVVLAAALERFIEVVGMSDRLIHSYSAVDYDSIWEVVSTDLREMISTLEALLADQA